MPQEEIRALADDQERIRSLVNEVLVENPELGQIPEAERMQLISEVLDKLRASWPDERNVMAQPNQPPDQPNAATRDVVKSFLAPQRQNDPPPDLFQKAYEDVEDELEYSYAEFQTSYQKYQTAPTPGVKPPAKALLAMRDPKWAGAFYAWAEKHVKTSYLYFLETVTTYKKAPDWEHAREIFNQYLTNSGKAAIYVHSNIVDDIGRRILLQK